MKLDQWLAALHAWGGGRVAAVLLATPFLAGAVVAVVIKKLYAEFVHGVPLTPGDWTVGVPLAALLGAAAAAILMRSYQVYRGANSRWVWVFRAAPLIATLGAAVGLAANVGRSQVKCEHRGKQCGSGGAFRTLW